jgi:CHAD domain-containing protein
MSPSQPNEPTTVSDSLLSYFDKQYGKLLRAWRRAADRHNVKGIHDYRVCVKRLNALFNLAASVNPEFPAKKRFRRFRKLFKSSAALRDVHIQIEIAKGLRSIEGFPHEEYASFLRAEERAAEEKFDRFSGTFEEEKLGRGRKSLAAALELIGDEDAGERALVYFRTLAAGLVSSVEDPQRKESDLHHIRMRMKETHYTCEIIRGLPQGFEGADTFIAGIKKVHQALGKWHDLELALASLERFASRRLDIDGELLESARKRIARKKAGYYRSFERRWKEFMKVARDSAVIS